MVFVLFQVSKAWPVEEGCGVSVEFLWNEVGLYSLLLSASEV